jgi:molybdopterin synthase catalytic subunit
MIRVQQEDFDVGAELAALTAGRTDVGGVTSFVGLVRDMVGGVGAGGTKIAAMTLEHYPGMTEKALAAIEAEALARWPLNASLIIHRYGRLARAIASCWSRPRRRTATRRSMPVAS